MDEPTPTARSTLFFFFSPLLAPHLPATIAETICSPWVKAARGGIRRTGPQRVRVLGARHAIVLLGALGAGWAWSGSASASDGVLEINQTCAEQTGCFAGDTAGFPVTISASGSYVLTSNLTGPGADTDGLFLSTSRVTIDFNGFSLTGPSIGSGTGNGVAGGGTLGSFAGFTTLKNGVIRGFRAKGVAPGGAKGVRIEEMTLQFNAGGGASVGDEARILRNGFSDNGGTIIANHGLTTGVGAMIVENVVSGSGGRGIAASDGSIVSGNTASQNGNDGIVGSSASTVSGNTVYENDSDGIFAGTGSTVWGNTVALNTGFGLRLVVAGYRENVITSNTGGTVSGGTNAGNNVCNGSTTCP